MLPLLAACACLCSVGSISLTGTFTSTDQTEIYMFSLSGTGNVTLQTFGFVGGGMPPGTQLPLAVGNWEHGAVPRRHLRWP
jgi:hypothetical protein